MIKSQLRNKLLAKSVGGPVIKISKGDPAIHCGEEFEGKFYGF
jgi:hypothetical protein